MPRELPSRQDQATPLSASPNAQTPRFGSFAEEMRYSGLEEKENLHPYIQTLTVADLESCVALENAAFPEHERCSREKVQWASSFPLLFFTNALRILQILSALWPGLIGNISSASIVIR